MMAHWRGAGPSAVVCVHAALVPHPPPSTSINLTSWKINGISQLACGSIEESTAPESSARATTAVPKTESRNSRSRILIRELHRSQLPLCLDSLFRRWYFDGCGWTPPLAFFRFLALVLARSGLATVSLTGCRKGPRGGCI